MADTALEAALFAAVGTKQGHRRHVEPDWSEIHRELKRKHVTLMMLWDEYIERCPEGYRYSRFCELYRSWAREFLSPRAREEQCLPADPARAALARPIRGGSGRGRWLVVSSTPRRVLCRIPNATVQSKCWAARSIMLDGANPGLALRCGGISGIINPVPQIFLREVCVSHALLGRQSQPDRTHSAPTYWLREGLRGPPSVSFATTHRRDQAHADEKRARGPASASDSMEPSQVRTRLSAGGGSQVRTRLGRRPDSAH
jgi:hypothetical protein